MHHPLYAYRRLVVVAAAVSGVKIPSRRTATDPRRSGDKAF
jgi:hypothetical protein